MKALSRAKELGKLLPMSYPSDCGVVENLFRDILKEECDQTTSLGAMERLFLDGRQEKIDEPMLEELEEMSHFNR